MYSYMASCYSFTDEIAIAISCLSRQYLLLSSFTLQEGCSLPNSSGAAHHSAIKYSGHLHYSAWAALPAAIGKGEQGQYHSCLNSKHRVYYSFEKDPYYHLVVHYPYWVHHCDLVLRNEDEENDINHSTPAPIKWKENLLLTLFSCYCGFDKQFILSKVSWSATQLCENENNSWNILCSGIYMNFNSLFSWNSDISTTIRDY